MIFNLILSVLMVITLCGMNFTLGFFIGKGKLEVKRKLTKDEKKELQKLQEKEKQAIEEYNKKLQEITEYNDFHIYGGEE